MPRQLLYSGPWVAERTAAVGAFITVPPRRRRLAGDARHHPAGRKYSAVDAFEGQYELADLKARAEAEMKDSTSWPCRPPARSIA